MIDEDFYPAKSLIKEPSKNELHQQRWGNFSTRVSEHIEVKGEKYNKYNTESFYSLLFIIDSIFKYVLELKVCIEEGHDIDQSTIYSIAHMCSWLQERLNNAKL